nr:uncharacterized protein LOC123758046 [Procambarus clarkii]
MTQRSQLRHQEETRHGPFLSTKRTTPIQNQQYSEESSSDYNASLDEVFRNDQRVTLSLTRLAVSASGQYRCEVIAEHPSFRTEASTSPMTVLREPLSPPVLVGAREIYEPTELIKIGCQPKEAFQGEHKPTLQWFLEGSQVESEWVSPYTSALRHGASGLSLHVPGEQIAAAGGSLQAECRLTLGPHQLSAFKTLRVRVRMISYVDNYQSSGSWKMADSVVTVVLVTVTTLLSLV